MLIFENNNHYLSGVSLFGKTKANEKILPGHAQTET